MLRFCNISSFLCLFFRRDLARPIGVPVKVGKDFWGMGIPYKVRHGNPTPTKERSGDPYLRVRTRGFSTLLRPSKGRFSASPRDIFTSLMFIT